MSRITSFALIFLYRIFRFFLRLLPMGLVFGTFAILGRISSLFFPKERKIASAQLELCANTSSNNSKLREQASPNRIKKLIGEMFAHFGRCVAELIFLDKILSPESMVSIEEDMDEEVLSIIQQGKAAVALSAHIGCFELLAAYYSRLGAKLSVVGRDANYRSLSAILHELRASYNVDTIWRHDKAASSKLLKALREGRIIAVLIDQDTGLKNAFSKFFWAKAASPVLPIKLAIKYKLPVCTTFIVRESLYSHRMITWEIEYDPKDPLAGHKILDQYNRRLEQLIQQYPEQWPWWHRRWRRRPESTDKLKNANKLRNTEEYLAWLEEQTQNQ